MTLPTQQPTQQQQTLTPFPSIIIIDDREKAPYTFAGLRSPQTKRIWDVSTRSERLAYGDYAVTGARIERKSLADFFGTIAGHRERFEEELTGLDGFARRGVCTQLAAVVVEADWSEILYRPPPNTRLPPQAVLEAALRWQHDFPGVHWWFVPGRRLGEMVTLRLLVQAVQWGTKDGTSNGNERADPDLLEGI